MLENFKSYSEQILLQLRNEVPRLTDIFNDKTAILTAIMDGDNLKITTAIAGFVIGQEINIDFLKVKNQIESVVIDGDLKTLKLSNVHDFTTNYQKKSRIFNGVDYVEYDIISIVDDKTLVIQTSDTIDDSMYVIEDREYFNDSFKIVAVNGVEITLDFGFENTLEFDVSEAIIYYNIRINVIADESFMLDNYLPTYYDEGTKETSLKPTLFFVKNNSVTSYNSTNSDDATDSTVAGENRYTQKNLNFSLFFANPSNKDSAGGESVILAEEIDIVLNKCLFGFIPLNNYEDKTNYILVPNGDGVFLYNKSVYIHEYNYQVPQRVNHKLNDGVDFKSSAFDSIQSNYRSEFDDFEEIKKTDDIKIRR